MPFLENLFNIASSFKQFLLLLLFSWDFSKTTDSSDAIRRTLGNSLEHGP